MRESELARRLWPHLRQDVHRYISNGVPVRQGSNSSLSALVGDPSIIPELEGTSLSAKLRQEYLARVAADAVLDGRIDNLIITSGSSSAEVTDARGDYATLSDRLNDIYLYSDVYLVDSTFASDETGHNRFNDIGAAMTAATSGTLIMVSGGVYTEDVTWSAENVTLLGAGMPYYDSVTGRLIGGTIIRGVIDCDNRYGASVRNLGVDLVGVDNENAITASNYSGNIDLQQTFENLVLLGNGYDALGHAIENNGGCYSNFHNIRMYYWYHGLAILASRCNVSNIFAYACGGDTIIIKSKESSGDAHYINVSNVVIDGDDADNETRGGPIIIQSAYGSYSTRYINVSNVTARGCVNGVMHFNRLSSLGEISDVNVTNVTSVQNKDLAAVGDFWLKSGTRLTFTNCRSIDRDSGYGFKIDTSDNIGDVYLYGCSGDDSGSGDASGAFVYAQINGDVVVDTRYRSAVYTNRMSSAFGGFVETDAISVTGSNVNIANISGVDGGTTEGFSGLVLVHARSNTTTSSNIASYALWCHRTAHDTSGTATTITSAGLTAGSGSSWPSFTFNIDATNHKLRASVVGSTSASFYFSFTTLGNVRVTPL